MTILEGHDITYEYLNDIKVLDGVSFSLKQKEGAALIGANGAGKSTLFKLILGLIQPLTGEFIYNGTVITKKILPRVRQEIGLVFQNADNQLFCPTVYDDIAFGALNMGLSSYEVKERSDEALHELNISHLAKRPHYKLSAGEKRLVTIASVLVMTPKILLLDEPTAELDPRARRNLISLLNRLPQSKIIATHDMDLALKTCGKALMLYNGKIVTFKNAYDIISNEELLQSFGC